MLKIQTTISGFKGKPVTLFSAYDDETDLLIITKADPYTAERKDGCVILTNCDVIDYDKLFNDQNDLMKAIRAYFSLKNGVASDGKRSRLKIIDNVRQHDPVDAIEQDGMDANGVKYRLADGVTCGHVAVLYTCLHVQGQSAIEGAIQFADAWNRFRAGEIITI